MVNHRPGERGRDCSNDRERHRERTPLPGWNGAGPDCHVRRAWRRDTERRCTRRSAADAVNLQPIKGTIAEPYLLSRGFSPDACQALRFQPPATIVCPLVDDLAIPRGAQLLGLEQGGKGGWRQPSWKLIGAAPGLAMRIRHWKAGPLVLALGLEDALAYATLSDRAVWGLPSKGDRGAVAIPPGVSRVILATRPAADLRPEAMSAAQALAARGFEAVIEVATSTNFQSVLRWPEGRARLESRWKAEDAGERQSMAYLPDGRLWTYRTGWTRWGEA